MVEPVEGWSGLSVGITFGQFEILLRLEPFCDHLRFWVGWSGWSVGAIFGPFEILGRLERMVGWSHFGPFCDILTF